MKRIAMNQTNKIARLARTFKMASSALNWYVVFAMIAVYPSSFKDLTAASASLKLSKKIDACEYVVSNASFAVSNIISGCIKIVASLGK